MDLKMLTTVFAAVFVAELGGWTVFAGASAALVVASAIGVLAGSLLSQHINPRYLHYLAGAGFVAIGIWTLARA
jgi:putative Ca2+/H+ antiporter (TMEM165/GDT1 family)